MKKSSQKELLESLIKHKGYKGAAKASQKRVNRKIFGKASGKKAKQVA